MIIKKFGGVFVIWLLIIGLIFFIPLPIYITFEYKNNTINIYLYRFKISHSKRFHNKSTNTMNGFHSQSFYINIMKKLHSKFFYDTIFKPSISLYIDLCYGLEDAFITALLYGILHSISNTVYNLLSNIFRIKKFKSNIKSTFNKTVLSFTIKSITFISLVKIIYIVIMVLIYVKKKNKFYLNPKEVS
ncbi:MAG: DUF2953 domain-containing protein [Clostridium lundense]|nr:DUF2953 domain-containing protein [Clostridium thermopalmarium]MBE6078994.1 DUF2953 domain-containing protein [Clostridium lundense]